MSPALVLLTVESNMQERPPLWTLRFPNERHVRLAREAVALPRVTRNAGADDVFPSRQAAFVPWQDVIEVQLLALENLPAVLAGVIVALEHVVAGKFHFLLRQAIEKKEDNDAWDADLPRDRRDHFVLGLGRRDGKITPAGEIVGREIVLLIGRDDLGVSLIEEGESAPRRADVDRLPEAIQNQNLTVE